MNLSRRNFIRGSGLIIAAPAIIRVAKLMPISSFGFEKDLFEFNPLDLGMFKFRIVDITRNPHAMYSTVLDWSGVFTA